MGREGFYFECLPGVIGEHLRTGHQMIFPPQSGARTPRMASRTASPHHHPMVIGCRGGLPLCAEEGDLIQVPYILHLHESHYPYLYVFIQGDTIGSR